MVEVGSVTAKLVLDNKDFMNSLSQAKTEVQQFVQSFNKSNLSNADNKLNEISKALDEIRFSSQRTVTGINKLVDSFNNIGNSGRKIRQTIKQQEQAVEQVINKFQLLDNTIKKFSYQSFGKNVTKGMQLLEDNLTSTNSKLNTSLRQVQQQSNNATQEIIQLNRVIKNIDSQPVGKNITQGLNLLNQTLTGTNSKMNTTLRQMQQQFNNVDKEAIEFAQTVKNINSQPFGKNITQGLNLLDQALTGTNNKLNRTLRTYNTTWGSATTTVQNHTNAVKQVSKAQDGYNASANRGAEATLSEVGAMSTLGSIVGNFVYDMFYQLGSAIFTTVQATISAKSEMEGYFQQMNWSSGSIERFNNALESTVKQYQKLNKYNLGETMAALGVEFELNAQELANGMETVAMIQSEYVRAGRTEAEATLAVKDILQGEFLRLSRETGVGKEEVLEAGWDGDLKNMNSLLKALERIGKERHWDLFAQKANSLNDVLIITKNRMAELATDITSFVTPAIIGAFNGVLDAIDWLKSGFDGLGNTGQWIVGLNGLIPVIGGLTSVILRSRTGVGLLASANEGWLRTIQNLISGGNTLNERVGGWNGVFTALIDKIKGVDTASYNLIGALTNLDGELYKNKGTLNQLATAWAYNAGVITENEVATTKTTTAFRKLATSTKALKLGGLIALFTALAIVIADVTAEAEKNREAWNGLTDMYDNGQAIIDDAKTTYENLGNSVTRLKEKQATLKEGSEEYKETTNKLNQALKDQELAYKNIQTAQEAYEKAQEIKQEYDASIDSSNLQHQQRLSDLYKQNGYDAEEASRKASELSYNTAEWNRVATASAKAYESALMSGDAHITSHIQALKKQGATQEEINNYIEEYGAEVQKNAELQAKWKQGDIWAGLGIHLSNLKKTWIDLTHDETFMRFFNGLKEMIDTVTPSIMALASAIKDVLWFAIDKLGWLLESQAGQWIVFGGLVAGTIFTVAGKLKGFGKVISTVTTNVRKLVDWFKKLRKSGDDVGDVLDDIDTKSKGNDGIILESPDYGDLGGKGKPSNTPDDKDNKKNKKKSSGWLDRITGGIDWLSEGKNAKKMAKGVATGMLLVAEAIILIIPSLIAIGAVGVMYDAIEPQVNKGVEAIDKVKWVILAFAPPVIALTSIMSIYGNKLNSMKNTIGKSAVMIAGVMLMVAEVILLIIPSLWSLAQAGAYYATVEPQVKKGIQAIDSVKWLLLTIAVPIIALGAVLSYFKSSVYQITIGMTASAGIITIVMGAVAIVLWEIKESIRQISEIGDINKDGSVEKGIQAIDSAKWVILTIGVAIAGLGIVMTAITVGTGGIGALVAGGVLVAGTAILIGAMYAVSEVIKSMKPAIQEIANIGKTIEMAEIQKGVMGIQAVTIAIQLICNTIINFCNMISNIALTLGGPLGLLVPASTLITGAMNLMAQTIREMEIPLQAIADLGESDVDLDGVTAGTDYIKRVAYALSIIDTATSTLVSIQFDNFLSNLLSLGGDSSFKGVIDNLIGSDGVLDNLKRFAETYNEKMASFVEVDASGADKIRATGEAVKAVNDAVTEVKDAISSIGDAKKNANVSSDALPTVDGVTTVADKQRSESSDNSIKALLQEVESVITDLNDFNNRLNEMELSTANTTVAPFMNTMANTITTVKTAVDKVKLAVQGINSAESEAGGLTTQIGQFFTGGENAGNGSGLSVSLKKLYNYVKDIVEFNDMLNSLQLGETGSSEGISKASSLTQTLSNAIKNFTSTVTNSLGTLKNAGKSMGTNFVNGLSEGLSNIKSTVEGKLNQIDGLGSSMWTKGSNIAKNFSDGFDSALKIKTHVESEINSTLSYLDSKEQDFYNKGYKLGSAVARGTKAGAGINSPGHIYWAIFGEMNLVSNYLEDNVNLFYSRGLALGNSLSQGFNATNNITNPMMQNGVNPMMPDTTTLYNQVQTSAGQILTLNKNTTTTTNTTWSNLGQNMNKTFTKMTKDATSSYTSINKNTKDQLVQMRGVTENNIQGIRDSWNVMQNALINSAEVIRSQVTSKISQLEANMGSFWRKVRNPALLLSAGPMSGGRRGAVHRSNGSRRNVARTLTHGVSGSSRGSTRLMGAGPLNSGNSNFNLNSNINSNLKKIDLAYLDCLLRGDGDCYAGDLSSWNFNWSTPIKNSFKKWRTHFGAIYDAHLNVGKFENDDFPVRGNTAIFKNYVLEHIGKTHYEGYMGPQKGTPLQIWNSGGFNCYDGMLLISAIASAFGLSSSIVRGYWGSIPHVWANVQGVGPVDATAIQNGYGLFAPSKVRARGPGIRHKSRSDDGLGGTTNNTFNINVSVERRDGEDDDSFGERIASTVRDELIKLTRVNPSTGI